jgi:alpha-N-arabinofuranosidase
MLSRRCFSKSILAAPWILRAQQGALKARVKIDTERTIGDIDPKLYGNFIEHLGRCIYGGVFDEKSSVSDANGFRRDVLDAARKLDVTLLRWPGGNLRNIELRRPILQTIAGLFDIVDSRKFTQRMDLR